MKHSDTIAARIGRCTSDGGAGQLYMTHDTTAKKAYHFRPLLSYCLTVMLCLPSLGEAVEGIPCNPEPTSMIVNYGDLVNCQIDSVGDGDIFRFSGAERETIRVETTELSSGGPVVFEVFGPDGTEVCGGFGPADCRLTQTGTHAILVSEFANDGTVDYSLAFERISPPSVAARPIDYSQVLNDEINGVGDIDAFVFGGATDDLVSVGIVEPGGGGTDFFEVFGPGGNEICGGFGPADCRLTQTGAHTILVSEFFNDGTVPYSLALECIVGVCPPPPPPPPPPPSPVEAMPATPQNPIPCTGSRCRVPIACDLAQSQGASCANRIDLFAFVPRRVRFAFGIANVPPGAINNVKLRLTTKGKEIFETSNRRRLSGVIKIRNRSGTVIESTRIRIKLAPR